MKDRELKIMFVCANEYVELKIPHLCWLSASILSREKKRTSTTSKQTSKYT